MSAVEKKASRRSLGALSVAAGILLSRIAGLVRERVFAHYLGNSDAAGAFKAALRIPNLLQNLFGEGVLSASFVPVYSRLLAEKKYEEAGHVAGTIGSLLLLVIGLLTLVGVNFSHEILDILAPGFTGETRELTETLVRIMFPGTGLLVLSAWCLGILNSHRQFFLSYVAPVLWNTTMIVVLIVFGRAMLLDGPDEQGRAELVRLVAWATVIGAGLQFLIQLPFSIKANKGLSPSLSSKKLRSGSVKQILTNFVPAVITRGVVQISAYIDQILASYLGAQAVAGMAYAQTIYLLPISLFGMSVSAAELPEMSKAIGSDDEIATILRDRLTKSVRKLAFFVIPSAVAFLCLGDVVVATLFQTGQFTQDDARFVWLILAGSSIGLLANTQGRLCVSVFWALRDTRTPMLYSMLRVLLTCVLGYLMVFPLRQALDLPVGYAAAGLTASAGIAGWIEFLMIKRAVKQKIGAVTFGGPAILRCWLASFVAAGLGYLTKSFSETHLSALLNGVLVLGVFGGVYVAIAMLLGVRPTR